MSVYMKLLVVISLMLTLSHVVQSYKLFHLFQGDDDTTLPTLPHVPVSPRVPTVDNRPPPTVRPLLLEQKKRTKITDKQKSEIVRKHNALRAQQGASDMEMMMWSESLAAKAAETVTKCEWYDMYDTSVPQHRGQNVFMMISDKFKMVEIIEQWYNETTNYDYDTGCTDMCSHYIQVVWATSRQIGCAYHICKSKYAPFRNAQFFSCNYLPAENFLGQKPFKKGPACSQCTGGAAWCKGKLCNSQCSKAGKDCFCKAICYNCATVNPKTCRCSCADGWHGTDCSERCEERSALCNPRFYNVDLCNHPKFGSWAKRNCPVMCQLCKWKPDVEADECPPVYAPGAALPLYVNGDNGCHYQPQRITLTLLSNVILSLTITWKTIYSDVLTH